MDKLSEKQYKVIVLSLFGLIVFFAGTIFVLTSVQPTEQVNVTTQTNEVTSLQTLLSEVEDDLSRLSMITLGESTVLIKNVSAQDSTIDSDEQSIIELVADIEEKINKIESIIASIGNDQITDASRLVLSRLQTIKTKYNEILESTTTRKALLLGYIEDSLDSLDNRLTQRLTQTIGNTDETRQSIQAVLTKYQSKQQRYNNLFTQLETQLGTEDSLIFSQLLFENNTLISKLENHLNSSDFTDSYLVVDQLHENFDLLESISKSYILEADEELVDFEAYEKIENAKRKLERAEQTLSGTTIDSYLVNEVENLLNDARSLIAQAQTYYDQGEFNSSVLYSREALSKIEIARDIMEDGTLKELDDRRDGALEKIEELKQLLAQVQNKTSNSYQMALKYLTQAQNRFEERNYYLAERLAKQAKDLLDGDDEIEFDETEDRGNDLNSNENEREFEQERENETEREDNSRRDEDEEDDEVDEIEIEDEEESEDEDVLGISIIDVDELIKLIIKY